MKDLRFDSSVDKESSLLGCYTLSCCKQVTRRVFLRQLNCEGGAPGSFHCLSLFTNVSQYMIRLESLFTLNLLCEKLQNCGEDK